MPAYNAAFTLERTYQEIPFNIVDDVILVDDASIDSTIEVAKNIGIRHIIRHHKNSGYGANQKTCYEKAFQIGADIIVMLHPDYQYNPKIIPAMAYLSASGVYPVVLGSRILSKGALKNGMPLYKYISNRFLTFFQNLLLNQKLSEYHTGFRVFTRDALKQIDLSANSDDFIFDNQVLAQIIFRNISIGEVSCPANYFPEASSINFWRSMKYGWGVLMVSIEFRLNKMGILRTNRFKCKQ